jgi:hypothetical protein
MNLCLELHYPDDVLERYAMGKLSALDYVPLEEHLLICTACQTNLLAVEDYVKIARAALAAPQTSARIGLQPVQCLGTTATLY